MSPAIAPNSPAQGEGATVPATDVAPLRVRWSAALSFTACVAYPFLVWWILAQRSPWLGLLLTLAALAGLCLCLPRPARAIAMLAVAALAGAAVAFASPTSLLFLPPLAVNLGLAWFFGRTLAPGREALITRFARLGQHDLDAAIPIYTRRLTWVWVGFFLAMASLSAVLAAFGAYRAWVWFTAVGNYLCVAALFAIEYGYRRWRFPRDDHVSPWHQILMMRAALRERGR